MYYKCCVPGCANMRKDTVLHKFPKCVKRLKKWVEQINCDLLRKKNIKDLDTLQVCHKHFETRFVTRKSGLLSIAYPTLFLESEILSGIPVNSQEPVDYLHDHNYIKIIHNDHNYIKIIHNDHNYHKQPPPDSYTPELIELSGKLPSTSDAMIYYTSEDEPQFETVSLEELVPSTSIAVAYQISIPETIPHYQTLSLAELSPSTSDAVAYPICINEIGTQSETLSLVGSLLSTSNAITKQNFMDEMNVLHFETIKESLPSTSNAIYVAENESSLKTLEGSLFSKSNNMTYQISIPETLSIAESLPSTSNTITYHLSMTGNGPQSGTLSLAAAASSAMNSESLITDINAQQKILSPADIMIVNPESMEGAKNKEVICKKLNSLPSG